jgi:hypothetical protein
MFNIKLYEETFLMMSLQSPAGRPLNQGYTLYLKKIVLVTGREGP